MRRSVLFLALVASLFALSCGGEEPPPEGFHLTLRFVSVDPTVFDEVRVTFEPQTTSGERFMALEPMSYEDGNITLRTEADGALSILLSGAYVGANAEDIEGTGAPVLTLDLWTTDETMRTAGPSVRVVGTRTGEQIAQGYQANVAWPLQLGATVIIPVECRGAVSDLCIR